MANYTPGEMNIETQKASYDSFWTWSIRTAVGVAVILVLMYLFLT